MYGVETYDFLRQLSDDVAKSCQDTTRNCESDIGVRLKKPSINPGEGDAGHDTVKKSSNARSEERRVGKECELKCRSRWSPYH